GTLLGVAAAAVEALCGVGARREELRGALGPSIGPCCFEVGDEVAGPFARLAPEVVRRSDRGRPHVDLRRANAIVPERAGLSADRLDVAPPCTRCDGERFYSFRRDGAPVGQMLSFIVAGAGAGAGAPETGGPVDDIPTRRVS